MLEIVGFSHDVGAVAAGALLGLAVLALASGYALVARAIGEAAGRRHAETARTKFWTAATLYDAVQHLEPGSAFRTIAEDALEAAAHREGKLTDSIASELWIDLSLQRAVAAADRRLRRSFDLLSATAATAPLIGLAGGLWVLGESLLASAAGGASIADATGRGLALTALGFGVAVPASLGRWWLTRRNDAALGTLRDFASDMRGVLLSNAVVSIPNPVAEAVPPGGRFARRS